MKVKLWNRSVPRAEIDQRARDARRQIGRLLVPRAAVTGSWLGRVLCIFSPGRPGESSQTSRTRGPLIIRRPRLPRIRQGWLALGSIRTVEAAAAAGVRP
jgi:hypothetical protein